jgi:hypothetical protein
MNASTLFKMILASLLVAVGSAALLALGHDGFKWGVAVGICVGILSIGIGSIANGMGKLKNDLGRQKKDRSNQ